MTNTFFHDDEGSSYSLKNATGPKVTNLIYEPTAKLSSSSLLKITTPSSR